MNAFLKQMKFYAVVMEDFFWMEHKSDIIEMCVILL